MLYPNYIHILLTHCLLLLKEILFTSKITSQNANNASQFLKRTFACASMRSAYLLRSEFQMIIRTLAFSVFKHVIIIISSTTVHLNVNDNNTDLKNMLNMSCKRNENRIRK